VDIKARRNIIGIDASTNTLAFCYMTSDGHPHMWGEFSLGKGADLHTRLGQAYKNIENLLDVVLEDTENAHCYIESAVKMSNIKTTINLSYMYGIIIGAMKSRGITVHEVSPITWQNFIGNKALSKTEKQAFADQYRNLSPSTVKNKIREFRKQRTIKWVKQTFDKDIESDNCADAFGICWYGVKHG
jgi:Holliday junction resolvasome RuvABC endonuclease subunit